MKSSHAITAAPPALMTIPGTGMVQAWTAFWFTAVSPRGLHGLRILTGLLFLFWLLPQACQQQAFFGLDGWFDRQGYVEADQLRTKMEAGQVASEGIPPVGWSLVYLCGSNATLLNLFYWAAIVVLILFTLGCWTRLTSILTWLIVVSFVANPATHFDADFLLVILAFYLMIGYVLQGQWNGSPSLGERILGSGNTFLGRFSRKDKSADPESDLSYAANLALRLLQVHFAIVVVTSGLHKLQGGNWWGGVALFHPLHPPLETTAASLQSVKGYATLYLFVLSLVQYLGLAWQIAFPAFAWKKSWRIVLLTGAVVGWLSSAYVFRQPLFGPIYLIGCLSYLSPGEWQKIAARFSQATQWLPGLVRTAPDKKAQVQARN